MRTNIAIIAIALFTGLRADAAAPGPAEARQVGNARLIDVSEHPHDPELHKRQTESASEGGASSSAASGSEGGASSSAAAGSESAAATPAASDAGAETPAAGDSAAATSAASDAAAETPAPSGGAGGDCPDKMIKIDKVMIEIKTLVINGLTSCVTNTVTKQECVPCSTSKPASSSAASSAAPAAPKKAESAASGVNSNMAALTVALVFTVVMGALAI